MKKKFFLVPVVAAAFLFAACSTEDYPWDPNADTYDTTEEEADADSDTSDDSSTSESKTLNLE